MTVYIPTMSRYDNLRKIVPAWLKQNIPVRLVVEAAEFSAHSSFRDEQGWKGLVRVIPAPRDHLGIGYARGFCVTHARHSGLESIIMSDDDMRPVSDAWPLLDYAENNGVLGIGAVRGIHDRFTGGAVSANRGPILCPGGWGFQLFALNVRTAIDVGNFDKRLHSYGEDGELCRQGIARGIPWLVHCDVKCAAIGKRYAPGGISARFARPEYRTDAERQCLAIIHDRWPAYTNRPDQPLRVAWQKMLNDYIPDWRERSAIHGGML
jgi:hypothetical protein